MEIDSCREDRLEAYSLLYNRTRFGFVSKINMDNLKYFSIENQKNLGKIDIKIDINSIKRLQNNKNMNYLIMTQYQQIIPMIYFLRSQPASCKILTTKIMLQTAVIYAQDFYHVIKKKNQVVTIPTYEQESQTYDNYQINLHINCGEWITIYSKDQITNFVNRAVTLNYGQIYDTQRGTFITPYPSGINIGSAVWLFQNRLTRNKLLWVQGLSHHKWRACQQFQIDPIHNQINNIVFTAGVLTNQATTMQDEQQCLQFLKIIQQRLSRGNNSRIVIHDFLIIADIINYMFHKLKEKIKRIFFTGASVKNMMSYVNSYPQFLTWNHNKRIYQDPPVYPFETFVQFREKVIAEGTLQQLSTQFKVPLKQLTLKSTPYIQFEADFHSFLVEGQNQVAETMFEKFYDLNRLRKFLNQRRISNIICICKDQSQIKNIPDLQHSFTLNQMENHIFIPDQSIWKYYTVQGSIPQHLCQYKKKNGWLKLSQIDKNFRQLSKDWHLKLCQQFHRVGVQVLQKSESLFLTKDTRIIIQNYKISIISQNQKQLLIISSVFNQCSKLFKINESQKKTQIKKK